MTAPLTVGALFAGYGGLELGLSSVVDTDLSWFAEFDDAPSRVMAHHHPGVPNLGDVTAVDWHSVAPVDVITGGSPCQDLSHAGKRAGMKAGTRSGLWASMCDAIDIIRPRLVIWENVRGALSASADSAVEPCPICVGDGGRVTLRALGRVLGDLAAPGMTRAGTAYALPTWVPLTDGSGSSSSRNLPTPTSRDYKNVGTLDAFHRRRLEHPHPLTEVAVHVLGPTA